MKIMMASVEMSVSQGPRENLLLRVFTFSPTGLLAGPSEWSRDGVFEMDFLLAVNDDHALL